MKTNHNGFLRYAIYFLRLILIEGQNKNKTARKPLFCFCLKKKLVPYRRHINNESAGQFCRAQRNNLSPTNVTFTSVGCFLITEVICSLMDSRFCDIFEANREFSSASFDRWLIDLFFFRRSFIHSLVATILGS